MEDLTNIWNAEDELNEDELLNYVKGKSSADEEHNVEKKMADSSFVNDAVEGLQNFSSAEKVNSYVQKLNDALRKNIHTKKNKNRSKIQLGSWEIIAVVMIILLCILGYVIIQMLQK